ncbi:fatty acid transporter protein-like protein [Acrodontium crateriforme]|uniref:Very long-chain fatty acid transport protein n=1 Tax=Acrodontium crateriforme TaxID=150365 RepID=A0AAQ3R9K3_9PEZI|nr:fatty acid transporter protein-like protein [Acrodontium crateriforme]
MHSPLTALSDVPRSIAVPAIAASAAYLNAKLGIGYDSWLITHIFRSVFAGRKLEKQDRVTLFYRFEELALDPTSAKRSFLVVPANSLPPGAQTEWTYAEAYEIVLKYANWLKDVYGVQKNEIVAIDFTNKPTFIWLWFALWALGAKPAFINSNLRSKAFTHCVRVSTSRLLIIDRDIKEVLDDETIPGLGPDEKGRAVETIVLENEDDILSYSPYRPPDSARSGILLKNTAILIYTSGTTGLPKAANVPWHRIASSQTFWWKFLGLKSADRYFTSMPLYHSSASVLGVCQTLGAGCTIVIAPKFSTRTCMQQIKDTDATVFQYIGEMCRYLVTSPPSPADKGHKLRLAFGNGLRPDVWQRFKDRFDIPTVVEFYGATEAPSASFVHSRNAFLRGAIGYSGSLSRLVFGGASALLIHDSSTDMPARDPQTNLCSIAPVGTIGELVYALDPAAIDEKYAGYHGNEKASDSKILRDVLKKGDVFYRSGDLQRRDTDGRVWFIDRVGDTFRWKSENVSTAEVSTALCSHLDVREANVYGVELPNHDGRAGCAALTLAGNATSLSPALCAELAQTARKNLPKYAVPIFLRVPSRELDVTGTFKHQKVELRQAGVDPSKTGEDKMYWLRPGSDAYEEFGQREWKRIEGGEAKL